ncbi:rod shape-determining protein [Escherichia coli]
MRIGGDRFDEAIINYVRRNYGALIGEKWHNVSSTKSVRLTRAMKSVKTKFVAVTWQRRLRLAVSHWIPEILEALQEPLTGIVSAVMVALEQCPPELASISERGMVLTGGGALLRNLDRLLMEETGIPVVVAEGPRALCGARWRQSARMITCTAATCSAKSNPRRQGNVCLPCLV